MGYAYNHIRLQHVCIVLIVFCAGSRVVTHKARVCKRDEEFDHQLDYISMKEKATIIIYYYVHALINSAGME